MSDRQDDELEPRLHEELVRRHGDARPDAALEDQVVEALRAEGLIHTPRRQRTWWRPVAAAAAALAVFMLGVWAGAGTAPVAPEAPVAPGEAGESLYLLLLLGHARDGGPEQEADLVREYSAWAREQAERGRLVRGEKLGDPVRRLGPAAVDGVPAADRIVTGFFLLRAADLEEAVELAESCPHARRGGSIEVRPVEPT